MSITISEDKNRETQLCLKQMRDYVDLRKCECCDFPGGHIVDNGRKIPLGGCWHCLFRYNLSVMDATP